MSKTPSKLKKKRNSLGLLKYLLTYPILTITKINSKINNLEID